MKLVKLKHGVRAIQATNIKEDKIMKIEFKVLATRDGQVIFRNTLITDKRGIPSEAIDAIGHQYAPCDIKCNCINEGWYIERRFY